MKVLRAWMLVLSACSSNVGPRPSIAATPEVVEPLELRVAVFRWTCMVSYPGFDEPELHVPIGRPVRLVLASRDFDQDVIVNGIAQHVGPYKTPATTLEFRIDRPGAYSWQCPTDSGPNDPSSTTHEIHADTPEQYEHYLVSQREALNPTTREGKIALGRKLYEAKGCIACHSVDGTQRVGPTWAGDWGTHAISSDGSSRVVDAEYVEQSIVQPRAFARAGYPPSMPSFEAILKPIQIAALTAYIESLARPPQP